MLVGYRVFRGPRGPEPRIPGVTSRCEYGLEILVVLAFLVYVIGISLDKACAVLEFFCALPLRKSQADALLRQLARHWEAGIRDPLRLGGACGRGLHGRDGLEDRSGGMFVVGVCLGLAAGVPLRLPQGCARPWTPCFPRRSSRGWASAMTRRCTSAALPGLRSVGRICCGRPFVWPCCIRGRRATSDSWIACWRCTTTRSGRRRTVGWAARDGSSRWPSSRVG